MWKHLRWVGLLLVVLLAACQPTGPVSEPTTTVAPTSTVVETATPPEPTATTSLEDGAPADDASTPGKPVIIAGVPIKPGFQPNGTVVVQQVERVDLTGDGGEEYVVTSRWKHAPTDEFVAALQVDVVDEAGTLLYSQNTWEELGASPSESSLDEVSLWAYNQIESVEFYDLTASSIPELIVHERYAGTGAILNITLVSLAADEAEVLFEYTAYKGSAVYANAMLEVMQPLYLYNEANCCPCRVETITFAWEGTDFTALERSLQPVEGAGESCPEFPQPVRWERIPVAGDAPPARRDAALIHDFFNQRLLLFGGRNDGTVFDDKWAFDMESQNWQLLQSEDGVRPPARFSMVSGLDMTNGRWLITTGEGRDGAFFDDVWAFDLSRNVWMEVGVEGERPTPRYGASGGHAAYGDFLYLTHGFTDDGRFDDTWAFDMVGNQWYEISPEGERPQERCLHAAAPLGIDHLVLFGGCSSPAGPCPQGDTWAFDATAMTWEPLAESAEAPAARQFSAMGALNDRVELFLFGGEGAQVAAYNDVWALDLLTGQWQQLEPAGEAPAPRFGHTMTWVSDFSVEPPNNNYFVVFGGQATEGMLNDMWRLYPGDS